VTDYELVVNGEKQAVVGALATESLLYVLRERLGLTGAKNACEQGECGSCSVLVDGVLVCACLELAAGVQGYEIVTVEGLTPTDIQALLVEAGGVQCGFCTPGFVVAIHELLERDPSPSPLALREALAGNLCRCTGYGRIVTAVESVVIRRREVVA
jgi:carbon-monoxide dehydrogenase small subunit